MKSKKTWENEILEGIPEKLPEHPEDLSDVSRAPKYKPELTEKERIQAICNALRYCSYDKDTQETLAREFAEELEEWGRIYGHRFRPHHPISARPINEYPSKSMEGATLMLQAQNNLDVKNAQFPMELGTYGMAQVFQNWMQYRIFMEIAAKASTDSQIHLYSGHTMWCSRRTMNEPFCIITNGMIIPKAWDQKTFHKMIAMGVTNFGQMTCGSFWYIGSQGIVHGTNITAKGAGRLWLGLEPTQNLAGKTFVSSGLGGMSGAQGKAVKIAGGIAVIAEVNGEAIRKRKEAGWVDVIYTDLKQVVRHMNQAINQRKAIAIAYHGNVVDLWEYLADEKIHIDLGSDQTSCNDVYGGGYIPAGLSFSEARKMIKANQSKFKRYVKISLTRQVSAINKMAKLGMKFFDYGNGFLFESGEAGADIFQEDKDFRYPSYVKDIMGPLCFDFGFGPFRWVCLSGNPKDLEKTDQIATQVLERLSKKLQIKYNSSIKIIWIGLKQHKQMTWLWVLKLEYYMLMLRVD
jgi:urocanate hydratase